MSRTEAEALRADRDLVAATLRREAPAVAEFLERMRLVPRVLSVRNRRFGGALEPAALEDLTQDVLMAVWRRLPDFHGAAPLDAWVYRFCVLQFMARVRERRKQPESVEEFEGESGVDPNVEQPVRRLQNEEILEALEQVGPPASDVIRMRQIDELSFLQVGELLGISTSAAKRHYYRGVELLKTKLRSYVDVDGEVVM